jgi:outer membrane protein TolC
VLDTAAASAHAEAAGALDDPTLQTSYNRIMRMSELSLTQDIPLWGKRDLRRSAALAAVEVARGRERTAAAELDERIKVAFAQYNAASEALDVNAEVARVTEEMAKAATDRYARGLASQSEALGAQAEQVSVAAEMARLKNQQTSATARLNALLARPAGAPLAHPVGPRALPSSTPKLATLLERTRNASPLLSTQSAEIKGASVEQQLAEKAWNPDVTVGAGAARFDNGELGYTIMLGVKLPLQRAAKDAGAREAAAKLGAARERYAAAAAQIQGDLEEQLAALSTAQNIIDLFRNQQAPQLEAALQSVLAEYQRGGSDFRTVLENEHRLHDVRLTIIRSEVEGETALAAIERLIGGEL